MACFLLRTSTRCQYSSGSEGVRLSSVRPSWRSETKLLTGQAPLENVVAGPEDKQVMLDDPGVAEDDGRRRDSGDEEFQGLGGV